MKLTQCLMYPTWSGKYQGKRYSDPWPTSVNLRLFFFVFFNNIFIWIFVKLLTLDKTVKKVPNSQQNHLNLYLRNMSFLILSISFYSLPLKRSERKLGQTVYIYLLVIVIENPQLKVKKILREKQKYYFVKEH